MTITGNEIWEAMQKDFAFISQAPETTHPVYMELCELVVQRLELLSRELLSAETFVRSRIIVLTLLAKEGWIERLLNTCSDEFFGSQDRMDVIEQMKEGLEGYLEKLERSEGRMHTVLSAMRSNEEEFLIEREGAGLYPLTLAAWRKGGFTIEHLLRMQPYALMCN